MGHLEEAAPVRVGGVDVALQVVGWRPKTIFGPSGDQPGLKQPIEVGSGRGRRARTGISRRPLPSEWTTQIVLW